jgi:hypothetical protein
MKHEYTGPEYIEDEEIVMSDHGVQQLQKLLNKVQKSIKKKIEEYVEDEMSDVYEDITTWIECDSIDNFRRQVIRSISYNYAGTMSGYDMRDIRQGILKHNRESIVEDLNKDLVEENNRLKAEINHYRMNK